MLKVIVRFDTVDSLKTIRMDGLAKDYPKVGENFSFTYMQQRDSIIIDLGKVFNLESFGDMILIQTEHVIAEVWIISGEVESELAEVLPFVSNPNALFMKGGKLTCLRRKGASVRVESLIKELVEMQPRAITQEFKLTLIKENKYE